MKRTAEIALAGALAAGLLSACQAPQETTAPMPIRDLVAPPLGAKDGLTIALEVPGRRFTVGQSFNVRLTAHNTGNRTIRIPAGPGAPMKVRIWRRIAMDWDEIKIYPRAAQLTTVPWQLAPGAKRSFPMLLTVEPDWPTHDTLAIVAELNGRPDLQARRTIVITTPGR